MNTLFQLISHEYRKYVFTRGFLLFFLAVPTLLAFLVFAGQISERTTPVRSFVVLDETGQYTGVVDQALATDLVRRELAAWDDYASTSLVPLTDGSFPLPAPFAPGGAERRDAFAAAGGLTAALAAAEPYLIAPAPPAPSVKPRFARLSLPEAMVSLEGEDRYNALRGLIRGETFLPDEKRPLFAAIAIPSDFAEGGTVRFYTNNLIDNDLRSFIETALTEAIKAEAYRAQGVDPGTVATIERIAVPVRLYKASNETGEEAGGAEFAETVIPLMLAYALFVMIMSIGGMLLTSTVEEKSNKIIEVLLSSVSAGQLMTAKLIGLALVGVTIPAILMGGGFIATEILGATATANSPVAESTFILRSALFESQLVPLFFFYFVLGYLLFASIYLAVGAMSNSIQDAQSFVGPLTIFLILPAPFLQIVLNDPNGLIARIMTWVPIYTPYAIMIRMSSEPPKWEIIGATALLIVFVIFIVMVMGRIYRNAVLASGGAPSLKQARELIRKQ